MCPMLVASVERPPTPVSATQGYTVCSLGASATVRDMEQVALRLMGSLELNLRLDAVGTSVLNGSPYT